MLSNILSKKQPNDPIKEEWQQKGESYAKAVTEMLEFMKVHGHEAWKGAEPKDNRNHLADEVIHRLRKANKNNRVKEFRNDFAPAHTPLIKYFENKGQTIQQMHFIDEEKVVFLTGTAYQKRQA